jgi:hypothetical protein
MKKLILGLTLIGSFSAIAGMRNQDVNCRVTIKTSVFDGKETLNGKAFLFDLGVNKVVSEDGSSIIKSSGEKTVTSPSMWNRVAEEGPEIKKDNFNISKNRFLANGCNGVKFQDHFKGSLSLSKKELRSVVNSVLPEIDSSTIKRGMSISAKTAYNCDGFTTKEVEVEQDKKYLTFTMTCGVK